MSPSQNSGEPFDYKREFDRLMLLVNAAADMSIDIDRLRDYHAHAEALGPFLDPTKYQWGGGAVNLRHQARVLDLAIPFIRGVRKLRAEILEELAK